MRVRACVLFNYFFAVVFVCSFYMGGGERGMCVCVCVGGGGVQVVYSLVCAVMQETE